MHREPTEITPLKPKSATHPRTELTTWEKIVSLLPNTPRPLSYLCESGNQRDYRDKVEQRAQLEYKTSKYDANGREITGTARAPLVVETPSIAFRGDMRHPNIVFENGMNAYSLKRQINRNCCDHPINCVCCCLPAYTCGLPFTLLYCIGSFFNYSTADECGIPTSPGDFCGQNHFAGVYRSGWAALAFTRNYHQARPYMSNEQNYWRYITYFPEGYIDFNLYSKYLIDKELRKDPYSFFDDGDGHFDYTGPRDVAEVVPRGKQAAFSANIIAAVNNQTGEILVNPHSVLYRNGLEQEIRNIMVEKDKIKYPQNGDTFVTQQLVQLFLRDEEQPISCHSRVGGNPCPVRLER